jgi:hypothetical protein
MMVASGAHAEAPHVFGIARVGVEAGDAPRAWHEGGLGRYLASDDDPSTDLAAQFALLWEPDIAWRAFAQATMRGEAAGRGQSLGLVEAYVERTFFLADDTPLRLRTGQFFLPVSREAVDPLWQSPYTLGLSALNSWIAEEVRPIGIDVSGRSGQDAASEWEWGTTLFIGNDSSGALLAWRGFAQHDRLSVLGEVLALPSLPSLSDDGVFGHQRDDGTRPFGPDLDGRPGYALRARYGSPNGFRVLATRFDNRGDRGLHRGEYAWRTQFSLLGGEWSIDPRWTLAGEWMEGRSGMGFAPGPRVDIDFDAAYLLASFALDERWRFSARIESFDIEDRDGIAEDSDDRGHAQSLSVLRNVGESWRLGLEWIHGDTRHAAAPLLGTAEETGGNLWRAELRRAF